MKIGRLEASIIIRAFMSLANQSGEITRREWGLVNGLLWEFPDLMDEYELKIWSRIGVPQS